MPKNTVTQIPNNYYAVVGPSIGVNYIEAQAGSSKKDFTNIYITLLNQPMRVKLRALTGVASLLTGFDLERNLALKAAGRSASS